MTESISAEQYRAMVAGKRGARSRSGPKLSESDFQKAVTDMADALGWTWHHETYSLGTEPGYPDLTLVHPRHGVVWLELKTYRGQIYASQQAWIDRLVDAGQHAYIVYPDDMDLIEQLLKGEHRR